MTDQNIVTFTHPQSLGLFGTVRMLVSPGLLRLKTRRSNRVSRAAFMSTVHLDDALLNDIGVTREEVEWAARLPLSVNAARALHRKAQARRVTENRPASRSHL
ncbi:MAG: DUF1127 domain-containing protein [Rhodobacteraceae bacterium]|nr:DUF1127 domain-containing protein [Paracoccaceae bacterium]